jgi:indolepyruvate ferredoxin oxidoreductase beta subunit
MSTTTNLIFAGVGGQGVLLIAEMTSQAAARCGFDVKQTEVHGVSQRGGSVESHVRFGAEVFSPLVVAGTADVVVGLEKLEGLRYAGFVRQQNGKAPGVVLVNDHEIIPGSVANAAEKYPHQAVEFLKEKNLKVIALPASTCAKELGDGRIANVIMLGAMSKLVTNIPEEVWKQILNEKVPKKFLDLNVKAFEKGRSLI